MTTMAAVRDERPRPGLRLGWGAAVGAAMVVTFTRPVSWAVGLAGFLARGGIVALALPILVLPTPSGLQNVLGGPVSSILFGAPSQALLALLVAVIVGVATLLVLGTAAGAWAERTGIRIALEAAADEGLEVRSVDLAGAPGPGRIAVVRLLGLVPLAVALLLAAPVVYAAVYQELILPAELRTPLVIRVVAAAPVTFLGIFAAWLVGDAAASAGVRRLVLDRTATPVAWLLGWWDLVRRFPRVMGTALVTVAALVLCVAPGLFAASVGWTRVREAFLGGGDPVGMTVAVIVWVAAWLGTLVLAGAGAAFRNAAWTFEAIRRR